jgi:type IV secretion system protein VirB4
MLKVALKGYTYQKELYEISKTPLLLEKTGLKELLASDQGRPTDFGMHQMNVFLLADSIKSLENAVSRAVAALGSLGAMPMREDIKFEECYWAQLPANFEFMKRLRPINTARLGGFANLTNFPAGNKEGNHWGAAVTTFLTASRTPYYFNFHNGVNGHTTLIGPEGAGKTVLLNFLLAQACKFDNKLFFFDMNRSSEIFLRSLSASYTNPWPGADERPYAQVSLNPFRLDDTLANRAFLRNWMASLAASEQPELLAACDKAIAQIMLHPKQERRLGLAVEIMRESNRGFIEFFSPWVGTGEFAAVFDHPEDSLVMMDKIMGFEMAAAAQHPKAMVPVMFYLLHRIGLALDGKPTIIVLGEAWKFLDNPFFISRMREWLRLLTAKNAIAIFATEHVEETSGSGLNTMLAENIATQLYLPDESADSSYEESFGLNEKEISYLTVMNTEDRHFLVKRGANSIVVELNLSGMMDIHTVLSSTPQSLQAMERAIAEQGITSSRWMPKFLGKA